MAQNFVFGVLLFFAWYRRIEGIVGKECGLGWFLVGAKEKRLHCNHNFSFGGEKMNNLMLVDFA